MVKTRSAYLMPDGTSRAKVGKMGTSLVYIAGKAGKRHERELGRYHNI